MPRAVRISLANKCQLLFGAAVLLILTAALAVVWVRMERLVHEAQRARAREIANAWLSGRIEIGGPLVTTDPLDMPPQRGDMTLTVFSREEWQYELTSRRDPQLAQAIERLQASADRQEQFLEARDVEGETFFRYVRSIRQSQLAGIGGGAAAGFSASLDASVVADPVRKILLLQMRDAEVQRQLMLNRIYIVAAGLFAGLLAIGVFWYITTRLILSPVRVLRDTAEKVSEGDLNIRSEITTGDEFEQLSDVFNTMLVNLKLNQDKLRSANKTLDLKLGELAQSNVALYEANKIKGEFLANVSHELRTPLNSIVGFAEVLGETLKGRTGPVDEKRIRYVHNIIGSSRQLLELINDLLDLAKIEAGRMDVNVSAVSIADTAEGLINLIRPQAEKAGITLRTRVAKNLPVVQTDAGKLQQVLFNFLSNAVKFTPHGGEVMLSAELLPGGADADGKGRRGEDGRNRNGERRVRISVSDTGPGIAPDQQERIFEKFTQLDPSVTKHTGGTGLGLTISRELAALLQGRIELDSDVGRGATFSIIIPLSLRSASIPLMPDLVSAGDAPPGTSAPPAPGSGAAAARTAATAGDTASGFDARAATASDVASLAPRER